MKKVLTFLFGVFLICGLFVSCNDSTVEEKNGFASVSFEGSMLSTKALSAAIETKAVEDVYWYYTAVKTDGGPNQGSTASHAEADAKPVWGTGSASKGLAGKVVTVSAGSWKFRLYGYTEEPRSESNKVYDTSYDGTEGATGTVKASQIAKVKVNVKPVASGEGNGTLAIKEITAAQGTPKSYWYQYKTNTDASFSAWEKITSPTDTGITKSLPAGIYTVKIGAFYNHEAEAVPTTDPEREGSIAVQIYSNLTTKVTGSIDDLTGGVEFDAEIDTPDPKHFMVTYNANGANGGDVPVDTNAYKSGDSVKVLGNTATEPLTKDGHTFGGWTTSSDGSGTVYKADETFAITEDTILYAKWNALKCLDFSSEETFTLGFESACYGPASFSEDKKLFISGDNSDWTTVSDGSEKKDAEIGTDGKYHVYVRGKGLTTLYDTVSKVCTTFTLTGNSTISCSGDVMTLLDYENPSSVTMGEYAFACLFSGCTSLVTAPALPATELADRCYWGMFSGCTELVTAPELLPATTLKKRCYYNMFYGCTKLTTAPALPATELADRCYTKMFSGCTSLVTAPALPALTIPEPVDEGEGVYEGCYAYMFSGCTSLVTAPPVLPATKVVKYGYLEMFSGCTSLVTAPALPATELAEFCYNQMFYGCTSLTTAPVLPATTLAERCYMEMFSGCTSLNSVTVHFTQWTGADNPTIGWLSSVSESGTFTCPKDLSESVTTRGDSSIPKGWTVVNLTT